jgi:hypothetical protein
MEVDVNTIGVRQTIIDEAGLSGDLERDARDIAGGLDAHIAELNGGGS